MKTVKAMEEDTYKNNGGTNGLGLCQWSGSRNVELMDYYIEYACGSDTITKDQAREAECKFLLYELK